MCDTKELTNAYLELPYVASLRRRLCHRLLAESCINGGSLFPPLQAFSYSQGDSKCIILIGLAWLDDGIHSF